MSFLILLQYFWCFTLMTSATLSRTTFPLERSRLLLEKTLHTIFKIRFEKSSVYFSLEINDELTYFARIFIPTFFAGLSDNSIAGKLAYKTTNNRDTTVLKDIDGFFSQPRDSRPMFSVFTSIIVIWLWQKSL